MIEPRAIHQALANAAETFPRRAFLTLDESSITYGEAHEIVGGLAGYLHSLGVSKGKFVSIFSENSIEQQLFVLGVMRAGGVAAVMGPALREQLTKCLAKQTPRIVFYSRRLRSGVERELRRLSYIQHFISSEEVWRHGKNNEPYEAAINDDDPAHLQYSSGSTGPPNAAILSHGLILRRGKRIAEILGVGHEDRILSQTSGASSFFLMSNLMPALSKGASSGLMSSEKQGDPELTVRLVEKERKTILVGNPHTAERLLEHIAENPDEAPRLSSLRKIVVGSGAVSPRLKTECVRLLNRPLVELYGQSEFGGFMAIGTPRSSVLYPEFIGPVWADDGYVTIVGEDGVELPEGQAGEIVFRGPHMIGYLGNPTKEKEVIQGDRLYTQDIGYIETRMIDGEPHRLLRFLARKSEMIVTKLRRYYPRLVEDVLSLHPDIDEQSMIGVSQNGEEIPILVVTVKKGHRTDEHSVVELLKQALPADMLPERVLIRDSLPYTSTGKISKRQLKSEYEAALSARIPAKKAQYDVGH